MSHKMIERGFRAATSVAVAALLSLSCAPALATEDLPSGAHSGSQIPSSLTSTNETENLPTEELPSSAPSGSQVPSDSTSKNSAQDSEQLAPEDVDELGESPLASSRKAESNNSATHTATAGAENSEQALEAEAQPTPKVTYRVHVQTYGDQQEVSDGAVAGTSGESKRLEGAWMALSGAGGGIEYRTHVQREGWQGWSADGAMSGTEGRSLRLEALQARLTGAVAETHSVWYRVHAQSYGWLGWATDGEEAGTDGLSRRLEAMQVVVLPKGERPSDSLGGVEPSLAAPRVSAPSVEYRTHVQREGWQGWVADGAAAGTEGRSLRLEGLEARLAGGSAGGGIEYRTHVQRDGWQDWSADGAMSGTEGRSLRLEAACVRLTGEAAELFDVWYRVHAQTYGWLGWASNGDPAGTEGLSRRLEAIEVRITAKGSGAPGSTEGAFVEAGPIYSGDAELDGIVEQIINNHTGRDSDALRKAFDYIVAFPYIDGEVMMTGDWTTWSIPKAKQMYYRPGGNCYHYGSLMAWVARGLGYDARAVSGEVQGGVLGWSYHGWCEVTVDGTKYVIDPDLQKYIPNRNFFMVTYDQAPTYYRGY